MMRSTHSIPNIYFLCMAQGHELCLPEVRDALGGGPLAHVPADGGAGARNDNNNNDDDTNNNINTDNNDNNTHNANNNNDSYDAN